MPIQHPGEASQNPYTMPRQDPAGPSLPGIPWAPDVNKQPFYTTEPPGDPKDYYPGPIGPPKVPWWTRDSSAERFRAANETVLSSDEGEIIPQVAPDSSEQVSRSRPKQPLADRIQRVPSPGRSELWRANFWNRSAWMLTGEHNSMAAAIRKYPVRGMTTVAQSRRNTFRLPPPTNDEVAPTVNQTYVAPEQLVGLIHQTNRGTWRLG